ncbi:MAG: hypothetical protein JSS95_10300 [Acidobacteria bacterium]|nr:hypothetical protein [Acidobacteriota bacterium]
MRILYLKVVIQRRLSASSSSSVRGQSCFEKPREAVIGQHLASNLALGAVISLVVSAADALQTEEQ